MRKVLLLVACIFLISSISFSQKVSGTVKGSFVDSSSADGLADATISVMMQKDSSLISFTLSSNSGYFEIKNIDTGAYVLLFSFQGYPNLKKPFSINAAAPVVDFGKIKVSNDYKTLGEVVVTNEVPIKVNGDTVAYRADAFKVLKPNATAEDLLKKLPGVQVERDGTVKAQGENVQKVYVDGKEFFGNDPKLATKNLTADMIDQVEVYDDMSDQAKFTGMDDGSRTKAINLKLKKNKNKGTFGRAMAGYGTDDRYQSNLSANYFNGATKVSVIARANNTNNVGFSNNDMVGGFGGNSSGITKNWTAGANYSDLWGTNLELTGSYFFNHTNNINNSNGVRVTNFKNRGVDSTVRRFSQSLSDNNNDNHRINLRMIYTIDSMSSIIYSPSLNFQNSNSLRRDTTLSFDIDATPYVVGDSWSNRGNSGQGFSWSNNIMYRRKFSKRGRSFSVNFTNTYNITDRDVLSLSRIGNFTAGQKTSDKIINQKTVQENGAESYGVGVSYTEPIARDKVLEFNYAYNKNSNESDREVYDYNNVNGKFDAKNLSQTNLFENGNESNRLGTNYRVVKKKYNYQLGMAVQRTTLQSDNLSKHTFVEETYINLFPTAVFNYQFARSKNLRFNYRGRTSQPSTSQLQETLDQTNALNWSKGNAALNQEYSNNVSLNYNSFDMVKFRNFFFRMNFSNTMNKVVNNVITDTADIRKIANLPFSDTTLTRGVQLTTPVNANGAYNFGGNINVGFPINAMKGGNFNTSTFFNNSRDVSYLDSIKNFTKNFSLGESIRLSYNYKEKLDVGLSASVTYNQVTNTLRKNQNSKYYNYSASADVSYIFPKNFVLATDLDYYTNTGLASGYNQAYTLWNASFSKQLLKNNRGELKLSVFDILRQNRSISRTINETYIEDVQNSVVRQYFLLSFTYNLNRMGSNSGNGGNRMMQMGGGRNFRMMQ